MSVPAFVLGLSALTSPLTMPGAANEPPILPYDRPVLFMSDIDLVARLVVGEARQEPVEGRTAVVYVVLNRSLAGHFGGTVPDVVMRRKAFEPMTKPKIRKRLMSLPPTNKHVLDARSIVRNILFGWLPDPTDGATHFANVRIVKKRKNAKAMRWIRRLENPVVIGRHTFGRTS